MENSMLLTQYGFTIDPDGDSATVAALEPELGSVEIPVLGGKRFELLRSLNLASHGGGATMQAPVEIGVRPRLVLAYAAARVMTEDQLSHGSSGLLGWVVERGTLPDDATWVAMFDNGQPSAANSLDVAAREDLRARILHEVDMMMTGRLNQYRTNAGADELLLAEIASKLKKAALVRERGGTKSEEAELMARRDTVRVRLSEKRTLMAVKGRVMRELQEDAPSFSSTDGAHGEL